MHERNVRIRNSRNQCKGKNYVFENFNIMGYKNSKVDSVCAWIFCIVYT